MATSPFLDRWWDRLAIWNSGAGVDRLASALHPPNLFADALRAQGFGVPISGSWKNPSAAVPPALATYAVWGLLAENPEAAARWAFFDASAVCGAAAARQAAWIAALIALAAPGRTTMQLLRQSKALMPAGVSGGLDRILTGTAPLSDPVEIALRALTQSEGDFARAVGMAVASGGPADEAGLLAGLLSALTGAEIPVEWKDPLKDSYPAGFLLDSPPSGLQALLDGFAEGCLRSEPPSEVPIPEPVETEIVAVPLELPDISPNTQLARLGKTECQIQYLNIAAHQNRWELAIRFDEDLAKEPAFSIDQGSIHAKLVKPRLYAVVAESPISTQAHIQIGEQRVSFPLIQPQKWYACGPVANAEAEALDKVFRPEDVWELGEAFQGRSGIPIKWQPFELSGEFEIEPQMQGSPGAILLAAKLKFKDPGTHRVTLVAAPGGVIKLNHKVILRFQDQILPKPGAWSDVSASFTPTEECLFLVKLLRNREPASPVLLFFQNEQGQVVEPESLEWQA